MSKQRALEFVEAVEADSSLEARLAQVEASAPAWRAFAQEAGYEFGSDDLRCALETLVGRELTEADCVAAIIELKRGGLSDEELARVAGGLTAPSFSAGGKGARFGSPFSKGAGGTGGLGSSGGA